MSQRTVSAQLTAGWLNALNGAIQAYVVPSSVRVTTWTVRFGDDSIKTFPPDPSNPFGLTTTHTYGSGQFDVVVIAHVTGEAYGAFFAPERDARTSSSFPSRSTSATARAGSGRRSSTSRPS